MSHTLLNCHFCSGIAQVYSLCACACFDSEHPSTFLSPQFSLLCISKHFSCLCSPHYFSRNSTSWLCLDASHVHNHTHIHTLTVYTNKILTGSFTIAIRLYPFSDISEEIELEKHWCLCPSLYLAHSFSINHQKENLLAQLSLSWSMLVFNLLLQYMTEISQGQAYYFCLSFCGHLNFLYNLDPHTVFFFFSSQCRGI